MTQQMLVGYGPTGYRLTMTGPEGPVEAMLGIGPAGPVASLLTFNTITAGAAGSGRLTDVPTPEFLALPKGTLAYTGNSSATVPSVMALWVRMTSPTTISSDGITILKPLGGVSREIWARLPDTAAAAYWTSRYQTTGCFLDAAAGSDENFGSQAAPLATWAEFRRRIGTTPFASTITVTIVGDLGGADLLDASNMKGPVTVVGTPTVVLPGLAIAGGGYVPRVVATNTPNQLTCSTALVWTTHLGLGQYIRMTSGAAIGLLATAVKDLGANAARVSSFLNAAGVETQPAAADTFEIIAMSKVTLMRCGGPYPVTFQNIDFVTNPVNFAFMAPFSLAEAITFINCTFELGIVMAATFTCTGCQCMAGSTSIFTSIDAAWQGGALFDAAAGVYSCNGMSVVTFSGGALFQGCSIAASAGYLLTNDCGFFDTVTPAIVVRRGGTLQARTTWGNTGAGNPGAASLDRSGSVLLRGTLQTLTNGGGIELVMPLTANTTWAAARAANGVKDGATSNASLMVVA